MLSKSQIKFITSLKQKKFRVQHKLFIAEGKKTILELAAFNIELQQLYSTTLDVDVLDVLITKITEKELKKISFLSTPNTMLAVFKIPLSKTIDFNNLIVALDTINDPGNLGTIIRLCDWFGVRDIVCNLKTVDCYNPKVIQATMGSIARVNVLYEDLEDFLKMTKNTSVFGAFMEGETVYNIDLPQQGILVLGNEANGISKTIETLVTQKIAIPRFGKLKAIESLNVATATAILLNEFRRKSL